MRRQYVLFLILLFVSTILSGCATQLEAEVFVTGLNQPRGMVFDSAGNMYIAEAGMPDPSDDGHIQPATNHSSRISRIDTYGQHSTVLSGLPYTNYITAGDIGAADLVLLDQTLYILTGEGYDDDLSRSILQLIGQQQPERVANLMSFAQSITASDLQMSGGVPCNPFAMVATPDGSGFYVSDGASGRILHVTRHGTMRLFAEIPGMPPLTGLAIGPDQRLYVTMFSPHPHTPGSGQLWAISQDGTRELLRNDLTMPIDVAFDHTGALYILEFSSGRQHSQPYGASSGRLLRITSMGVKQILLTQLSFPASMIFAPSDDLYISTNAAFSPPGTGSIIRIHCQMLRGNGCNASSR